VPGSTRCVRRPFGLHGLFPALLCDFKIAGYRTIANLQLVIALSIGGDNGTAAPLAIDNASDDSSAKFVRKLCPL
jgi:hypothetical protein